MRILTFAIVGVVAALSCGASSAGDWSGFYAGGHVGGVFGEVDDVASPPANPAQVSPLSHDISGAVAGVHAGAQVQLSQFLIGVEGGYTAMDGEGETLGAFNIAPHVSTVNINQMLTAVGRVGFVADDWLFYAKGGYANAKVDMDILANGALPIVLSGEREDGYVVGGGVEWMYNPNVIFGLDYAFVEFDIDDRIGVETPFAGTQDDLLDIDATIHLLTARASFKF